MADIHAPTGADLRVSPRTNLMLSATAEAGGRSIPVRIRNLSETGALIEGDGLPGGDGRLILKRTDLEIGATIAWAVGSRRGIRFDGPVSVHAWTGGKVQLPPSGGHHAQRRVDELQAAVRAGIDATVPSEAPHTSPALDQLDSRLAEELRYVQRLLENLADELVTEPIVVQRHAPTLQSIDLAQQILAQIATIVTADDRAAAIDQLPMADLQARLKRKSAL